MYDIGIYHVQYIPAMLEPEYVSLLTLSFIISKKKKGFHGKVW